MEKAVQLAPIHNDLVTSALEFFRPQQIIWIQLDEWAMEMAQKLGP